MRHAWFAAALTLLACASGHPVPLPAAPAHLTATAGDGQVLLLWDAAPGALGYRLYSAAAAVTLAAPSVPVGDLTSYTASHLTNGRAYHFAVTASNGAGESPLSAEVIATPRAQGADARPPGPVTQLSVSTSLQAATLAWSNPGDLDYAYARVYHRLTGANAWPQDYSQTSSATVAQEHIGSLLPGRSYDFLVTTVDATGNEQPAAEGVQQTKALDFSGTLDDLAQAGEVAAGEAGGSFLLTWSGDELFAAYSGSDHGPGLSGANGDALWVAIDTDPEGDATGEQRTATAGANELIWPFLANAIVSLQPGLTPPALALCTPPASGPILCLHSAGSPGFAPLGAGSGRDGQAVEGLRFPKAAIGSPTRARLSLATVATATGYAFDLAPAHTGATNALGFFASATASFASGSALFDPAKSLLSLDPAVSPLALAPSLVSIPSAPAAGGAFLGPVQLNGSLHPLSYTRSDSSYQLEVQGDGSAAGRFNFGGAAGELFFQFVDAQTAEFASGPDRVYTLSGAAEAIPTLTFGAAWSASHSFALTFTASTGGAPTDLRGNDADLASWSATQSGLAVTGPAACPPPSQAVDCYSATHTFTHLDAVTTPMEFKLVYGNGCGAASNSACYEGGPNHAMNDDVLNRRSLFWSAGSGATF